MTWRPDYKLTTDTRFSVPSSQACPQCNRPLFLISEAPNAPPYRLWCKACDWRRYLQPTTDERKPDR